MTESPVEDGDETLSEAFWGAARQLRQLSRETLAPWDISPSHSRALGVLIDHGVMRLSELSDHLHIAPRSTTEVVDALQDRGLLERRPDPHDRRATLVSLTGEGERAGAAIRAARRAEADRFFGGLSAEDRAQLTRILRTLRTLPTNSGPRRDRSSPSSDRSADREWSRPDGRARRARPPGADGGARSTHRTAQPDHGANRGDGR